MSDAKKPEPAFRLQVGDIVRIRGNRMDRDLPVTKIGRDYYTVGAGRPVRVSIRPDRLPDDGSRSLELGRTAWLSEQAMLDADAAYVLHRRIRASLDAYHRLPLTLDQLRRIVAILDEQHD